jgi:predicted Zn finger-like uncharacterized protein
MPVRTSCPDCATSYTLADDQRGKKVRCKNCQAVFTVAAAPPPRKEPPPAPVTERPARAVPKAAASAPRRRADPEDDERPARRRPAAAPEGKKTNAPLFIGLSVLAVLVVAGGGLGVGFWIKNSVMKDSSTDNTVSNLPNLSLNGKPIDPNNFRPAPAPNPAFVPIVPPVVQPAVVQPKPVDPGPNAPPPDRPPSGNGQLTADVLKKVKDATAFMRVVFADGSMASGSGFFGVEENILLTNAHVLGMETPESRPPRSVEVVLNSGDTNEQILAGQVLGVDRHSDLAVLRVYGTKAGQVPTIPRPLDVRPAKNLIQTQKVYVFGFPLGERVGKEISITESSVASLRKNPESGVLERVQVNGGMDHGNSGGPVVDTNGDVIGVAVSKIPGTSIDFAVPGERVLNIFNGSYVDLETHQAYEQGSNVVLPVAVRMMDPLHRVKNVSVDVWVGNAKPDVRVAVNGAQAAVETGDSQHTRGTLVYADGVASGDVVLPALAAGKEYWLQPTFTNGAGQPEWADAHVMILKSPPVKREPATLVLRQKNATQLLMLDSTSTRLLQDPGGGLHPLDIRMQARLQEKIAVVPQGATLTYNFSAFDLSFLVDKKEVEELKPLVQGLKQHFRLVNAVASQDKLGNLDLQPLGPAELQKLPKEAQTPVDRLHAQTLRSLDTLAVPLPPGGNVTYGKFWQARRTLIISNGSSHETGDLEMTYTYQGTRKREGRDEAVIGIEGTLQGVGTSKDKMGGRTTGTAVLDLATGQVIQADAVVYMDMTARSPLDPKTEVRSTGRLIVKLQRELN